MTAATPPANATLTGILFMNAGVFGFALNDALVKWLAADYSIGQVILLRYAVSLLPILIFAQINGGLATLRPVDWKAHAVRALIALVVILGTFLCLMNMTLTDLYTIGFLSPVLVTALAVPLLGERVGWRRWVAVAVGFAGVLLLLRPGGSLFGFWGLICLLTTICYALMLITIRQLNRTEHAAAIVFSLTVLMIGVGGVWSLFDWTQPSLRDWALLIAMGLAGGVAQICITMALRLAPAPVVAPFDYGILIWALILDWLVWMTAPKGEVLLGAAVIVSAGCYIIWRESRINRRKRMQAA